MPTGYTHPLLAEGPRFEPWVVFTKPTGMYHLIIDDPDAPLYNADRISFLTSELFLVPHLFDVDKKEDK